MVENKIKLCSSCGYNSLSKISYSMDMEGNVVLHRKKGWKPNAKVQEWKEKKYQEQQRKKKHQHDRRRKSMLFILFIRAVHIRYCLTKQLIFLNPLCVYYIHVIYYPSIYLHIYQPIKQS